MNKHAEEEIISLFLKRNFIIYSCYKIIQIYKIQTSDVMRIVECINPSKHTRAISQMGFPEVLTSGRKRALQGQPGKAQTRDTGL